MKGVKPGAVGALVGWLNPVWLYTPEERRAEIDEYAWEALYSTVSRPFNAPETGKIAVKVTNHYGDEVMQVFEAG